MFDAWLDVPRKEDWLVMGLGDGTEKGSIRLIIRPDGGWGTRAFLTTGDQWGIVIGLSLIGPSYVFVDKLITTARARRREKTFPVQPAA